MYKSLPIALLAAIFLIGCDNLKVAPAAPLGQLDGETAALVNEEPIYHADVELEAVAQGIVSPGEAFRPGDEQYQLILDQLIDQRLLAQEAIRRNLDLDETAVHRLSIARERVLGNLLVENLVASEVTEEAIRTMYNEQVRLQQLGDEVRISLITVADEASANSVVSEYNDGTDFSALAFKYSTDAATRINGGDLGFIGPAEQPEPFSSMIANTATGDISGAFESETAWHVLKIEDRRQRAPKTLEEMRPDIVTFLTYSQINQILRDLRDEIPIVQDEAAIRAQTETETSEKPEDMPIKDKPAVQLPVTGEPVEE